jgi:hypothetical protein
MTDYHAVIDHPNRTAFDDQLFFKIVFESSDVHIFPQGSDVYDVLKEAGFFPSKNEARRQWRYGSLRQGMNRFEGIGKLRKNLYVLKLPDDFPTLSG